MTFFLLGSVGATLILGGVPVVLYGLMLETVKARRVAATAAPITVRAARARAPLGVPRAA